MPRRVEPPWQPYLVCAMPAAPGGFCTRGLGWFQQLQQACLHGAGQLDPVRCLQIPGALIGGRPSSCDLPACRFSLVLSDTCTFADAL